MNNDFIALSDDQLIVSDEVDNMKNRYYVGDARKFLLNENIMKHKDKLDVQIREHLDEIDIIYQKINNLQAENKRIERIEDISYASITLICAFLEILLPIPLIYVPCSIAAISFLNFIVSICLNHKYKKKLNIMLEKFNNNIDETSILIREYDKLKTLVIEEKKVSDRQFIKSESIEGLIDSNDKVKVRTLTK